MRMLRRTGPLVLAVLALGMGSYFVARAVKDSRTHVNGDPTASPSVTTSKAGSPSTPPSAEASPNPSAIASVHPPNIGTARMSAAPPASTTAPPAKKDRKIRIASLRPPFGVHLLIDGSPVPDPAQDEVLTFDDKPHALVFSCVNDICEPRTIAIAAGDKDDTISVALRVPPAKVVIDGEPGHSYRIEEMPGIALSPGAVSEVPIVSGGTRMITVFDVLDPSKKKTVQIEAGKQKTVSLKGP